MSFEGRLVVGLAVKAGVVAGVDIRSTRLVAACRVLEGKPVDKGLDLLPRLFAVCGAAQQAAGEAACEEALAVVPAAALLQLRRRRVLAETAVELGTRVLMDWPTLVGEAPLVGAARAFRAALAPVRSQGRAAGEAARSALIEACGRFDPRADGTAFGAWLTAGDCPAARFLERLRRDGLAGYGAADVPLMGELDRVWLGARFADDADGRFAAHPDCDGRVFETGPLARQADHPLVSTLLADYGPGLLARMVARLVELIEGIEALSAEDGGHGARKLPNTGCGVGVGVVEAARGRLVHRVAIEDGVIRRYQILAPTEWNFHADGPLARGLLRDRADHGLAMRAQLLVAALDPCVACDIKIY